MNVNTGSLVSPFAGMGIRLSCSINAFNFCVHYLCLIGGVYVFYVGHVDKSSLCVTLSHCNILSKHHHHQHGDSCSNLLSMMFIYTYDDDGDNEHDVNDGDDNDD
jgi:hypothetical protein